eukprot:scaffold2283_cov104-Isochrysis_galbana.AAC.8
MRQLQKHAVSLPSTPTRYPPPHPTPASHAQDQFCDLVAAANEPQTHNNSILVRQPHGVVAVCAPW